MKGRSTYRILAAAAFTAVLLAGHAGLRSQPVSLSGRVTDTKQDPLPGASVWLVPGMKGTVTDLDGTFTLEGLPPGPYEIHSSFIGYEPYVDSIYLSPVSSEAGKESLHLEIVLGKSLLTLREVVITDRYAEQRMAESPLNLEIVNRQFLREHEGGSLMKSLERLPGVSAREIGAGQSKPVIRGLGYNRVVVVENGIKHQGQQWGMDHGLEVDQYAVDRIEVIKGPSSIRYGSDAMGGVIELTQFPVPAAGSVGAELDLAARSNNMLAGSSLRLYARKSRLFLNLRGTAVTYGDYRVPADSIDIYSYRAPLYQRQLRNTAGRENALHLSAGYVDEGFINRFHLSRLERRNGFFANAHGLEPRRVDTGLHDRSSRDIQKPFHKVSHWKIINRTSWTRGNYRTEAELGFQRNIRQERSDYVNHGYMPPVFPDTLPFPEDLERSFDKQVYSGNIRSNVSLGDRWELQAGISGEWQENRIDGRGFIIPAFRQQNLGAFSLLRTDLPGKGKLQAGLRYDYGQIKTESYRDWFPSPVEGDSEGPLEYLERAPGLERIFSNLTWSVGYSLVSPGFSMKLHAGKSFRMPIAKELAANGVNYHRFSYEVGDPDLPPEVAYQLDAGLEWQRRRWALGVTPFISYFTNYIYLNPGYLHDRLYGNGNQIFTYTGSEVLRFGGEAHAHFEPVEPLRLGIIAEYLYSVQTTGEKKGFGLPFSPAPLLLLNARYTVRNAGPLQDPYLSVDWNLVARQGRIVPPEEPTPGYQVIHLALGTGIPAGKQSIQISFQVRNLLDRKYFNHTSYYRLIGVPEPGRNFILSVAVPIQGALDRNRGLTSEQKP